MPEIEIQIGGKAFTVACQDGEEASLHGAAALLDAEAEVLRSQIGRLPEARMLLMAGLMLADRMVAVQDQVARLQSDLDQAREEYEALRSQPRPAPERIEVPVVPPSVAETLAELAARAEALAQAVEDRSSANKD
ncbi:cell division protein ZapA [Halodurantibacterium flavum]|uniref:Cell division protein ZapA n=1 Tax=Halodurantibacterium flavum TaxID=1382802 RepID=A0ABW4S660_9RHOB